MLMKKVYLAFAVTLTVCSLFFSGCSKELSTSTESEAINENTEIIGTSDFLAVVLNTPFTKTKAGEVNEEELLNSIEPLFAPAIKYLSDNGYNYADDFDEDDPNIILTAFYLMACDEMQVATKSALSVVMDCVVTGAGLKEILEDGATRIAIKVLSKKLAARCVPYVGTAIFVVSTGACLIDNL